MSAVKTNIIVPFDLSELSLIALKQSYHFAKYSGSKINLLYVSEGETSAETKDKVLKIAKNASVESGLEIEPVFEKGNIYRKTNEAEVKLEAKFIILGLGSAEPGVKNTFSSSAFKMITEAKCPVYSIKEKPARTEYKNIILPLDLTKESREKVGKTIEYAKYFKAAIRIISVFAPNEENFENKLIAYSHQVKEFVKESGVACSNKTVESKNRAEAIVEYANKIEADLITIMTQTELSITERFSGTTQQKLLNLSNIPVMSIHPMERKDTTTSTSPF